MALFVSAPTTGVPARDYALTIETPTPTTTATRTPTPTVTRTPTPTTTPYHIYLPLVIR